MTNVSPSDQIARDRQARFARRDGSPIPLSVIERAERRHHSIMRLWQLVLLWGPAVFMLVAQLVCGGVWIAFFLVLMMRSLALIVGALIERAIEFVVAIDRRGWVALHTVVSTVAGVIVVMLTYQGAMSVGWPMSEVWLSGIGAAAIALWPAVFSALRTPTDYERMVWASQRAAPSPIVE